MKTLSYFMHLALLLLITKVAIPQTEFSMNYPYEKCYFYLYSFSEGVENAEKGAVFRNKLMNISDVYFVSFNYPKNEFMIFSNKDFNDTESLGLLKKMGCEVKKAGKSIYNADDYLRYYIISDHTSSGEITGEKPRFIKTGNEMKDNKNYSEAKTIWIEKYPAAYKSMIEKEPLSIEQKKEVELKKNF